MGQRFQTAFILPKVYMNEGNPNNRDKKVLIFHNQWLYGYGALKVNLSILRRLRRTIKERKSFGKFAQRKTDFKNHILERHIKEDVVPYSTFKEYFPRRNEFFLSNEYEFKGFQELGEQLSREDNNNGFFIVEITENLKIKYGFISGFEDEDKAKIHDPLSYMKLFFKESVEELKADPEISRTLKGFLQFEGLNLYELSKAVEELNENKPEWAKV